MDNGLILVAGHIVKPFNPMEVLARVEAILRGSRGGMRAQPLMRFSVGVIEIDPACYIVDINHGAANVGLDLTFAQYRLLP